MASINSTHITVKWDPPAAPNGIVNYTVVIEERNLLTNDLILIFTKNVTELELLVEYAVEAYSEYTTNVRSQTSAGIGETQRVTIQTPEEGKRHTIYIMKLIYIIFFSSTKSSNKHYGEQNCINLCHHQLGRS